MKAEHDESEPTSTLDVPLRELWGIAGAAGIAVGEAVVLSPRSERVQHRHVRASQVDGELRRLATAIERASGELRLVKSNAEARHSRAELSILDAYVLMLNDEVLHGEIRRELSEERKSIEWATESAVKSMASQLDGAKDPYLRERSHDIEFIGDMLLRALSGGTSTELPVQRPSCGPRIVIARDLSPAETASFNSETVKGIVTEVGTRTSHTAILARALDIPAVVGCTGILDQASEHERVIVDGNLGLVVLSPTATATEQAQARDRKHRAFIELLQSAKDEPARTRCGERVSLQANIELPFEAALAIREGADGVGLYRTEFLFVGRDVAPAEDEQYEVYRSVIEAMDGRPITFRTFDIGGDKFPSFGESNEANPALGLRAVRLALTRPEDFMGQLRAIARASAHGPLRIMVPMIATVTEFERVSGLLQRAIRELKQESIAVADEIPLGCMIEVPAAALIARHLSQRADFLSVGTNDLIQYTLAVDRGEPHLAYLANATDPAILKLLKMVSAEASAAHIPASVCGAMASDPLAAVLLIGLGFRDLSLEASAIASVKAALRRVDVAEAREVADEAGELASVAAVDALLLGRFEQRLRDVLELD